MLESKVLSRIYYLAVEKAKFQYLTIAIEWNFRPVAFRTSMASLGLIRRSCHPEESKGI